MKIHVFEKGMVLSGKSWEILKKLKTLQENYVYIRDCIIDIQQQEAPPLKRIK